MESFLYLAPALVVDKTYKAHTPPASSCPSLNPFWPFPPTSPAWNSAQRDLETTAAAEMANSLHMRLIMLMYHHRYSDRYGTTYLPFRTPKDSSVPFDRAHSSVAYHYHMGLHFLGKGHDGLRNTCVTQGNLTVGMRPRSHATRQRTVRAVYARQPLRMQKLQLYYNPNRSYLTFARETLKCLET